MSDFQLNADPSETQSAEYREGFASGQKDHCLGEYGPTLRNPHGFQTNSARDWRDGYEAGWEAAFRVKHSAAFEKANFQTNKPPYE
jgi:hypothetical protein